MNYTETQLLALTTLDRPVAVTAGAGSGKTRVLVARYLEILDRGRQPDGTAVGPENVLTITFTRKAAGEMRERIRRQRPGLALETAPITTIHGFCSRLLKGFPVEAGLDPQFTVLEADETRRLLAGAIEEAVLDALTAGGAIEELVHNYGYGAMPRALTSLWSRIRSTGLSLDEVGARTDQTLGRAAEGYRQALSSLEGHLGDLQAKAAGRVPAADLLSEWPALKERLGERPDPAGLARLRELAKPLRSQGSVKEEIELIKEGLESLEEAGRDLLSPPQTRALVGLLKEIELRYGRRKGPGHLDFSDLEILTRDLLRSRPRVAAEVRTRFPYVMVDEFQDTNGLQAEILSLLVNGQPQTNFFFVGDPKQSVYRFRGAEVEVFAGEKSRCAASGGLSLSLRENFRSQEGLVSLVNGVFGGEVTRSYWAEEAYQAARPCRPALERAGIDLILCSAGEGEEEDSDSLREREARVLALRLRELAETGAVGYGDVAVLMRALTNVKTYEKAFRRAGVPYQVVGGRGLFQAQEVRDILHLLRVLESSRDLVSLAGVLRSPLFALSDESLYWVLRGQSDRLKGEAAALYARAREILDRMRLLRDRIGLGDLVEQAIQATGLKATVSAGRDGAQKAANLEKLIRLALAAQARGLTTPRDFINYLKGMADLEGQEPEADLGAGQAVRIMSVHQSKGLEFPVVAVVDLNRRFNPTREAIHFDRRLGLGIKIRDDSGRSRPTGAYRSIDDLERRRELAENLRVLYVAMTRAKDHLILSSGYKPGAGSKTASGEPRDPRSWLDCLRPVLDPATLPPEEGCIEVAGARARLIRSEEGLARRPGTDSDGVALRMPSSSEPSSSEPAGEITWGPSLIHASVTGLLAYRQCPFSYYLERVLGFSASGGAAIEFPTASPGNDILRPSAAVGVEPGPTLSPTLRGSIIHRLIERLDRPEQAGPALERVLDEFGLFGSDRAAAQKELDPLCRNYLESEHFALVEAARGSGGPKLRGELPFVYRLPEVEGRPGVVLTGVIDRVVFRPDGRIEVVDFKTNRASAQEAAEAAEDYRFQVEAYSLVLRRLTGLEVARARLFFIRPGLTVDFQATEFDQRRAEEELRRLAEAAAAGRRAGDFPLARRSCQGCRLDRFCPKEES